MIRQDVPGDAIYVEELGVIHAVRAFDDVDVEIVAAAPNTDGTYSVYTVDVDIHRALQSTDAHIAALARIAADHLTCGTTRAHIADILALRGYTYKPELVADHISPEAAREMVRRAAQTPPVL